jgi:hypothetical protein
MWREDRASDLTEGALILLADAKVELYRKKLWGTAARNGGV